MAKIVKKKKRKLGARSGGAASHEQSPLFLRRDGLAATEQPTYKLADRRCGYCFDILCRCPRDRHVAHGSPIPSPEDVVVSRYITSTIRVPACWFLFQSTYANVRFWL